MFSSVVVEAWAERCDPDGDEKLDQLAEVARNVIRLHRELHAAQGPDTAPLHANELTFVDPSPYALARL